MSGKKDPRRAQRASSLPKMSALWADLALALRSKYMKMEIFKYLRSLSMLMMRHQLKKVIKKRNQRKTSFGLTASSLFQHIQLQVVPLINICLLGKTVKDCQKGKILVGRYLCLIYYRILRNLNFLFNAANLKKFWLSLPLLDMLHWFGLKHSLTLQVRVIMESIPANTFNYREEKQESLFQYLME